MEEIPKIQCNGCKRTINRYRVENGNKIYTIFCPYCSTYVYRDGYTKVNINGKVSTKAVNPHEVQ